MLFLGLLSLFRLMLGVEKHGRAKKKRKLREISELYIDANESLVSILSTN